MNLRITATILVITFLVSISRAQQTEAEQLRKQLKEATEKFDKILEEHRATIQQLNRRLEVLENQSRAATNAAPAAANVAVAETAATPVIPSPSWSPTNPIRIASAGQNYINLSFDGLFAAGSSMAHDIESLQRGAHDPKQRGFT